MLLRVAMAASISALLALSACGEDDFYADMRPACTKAGGKWLGDMEKAGENCGVTYGGKQYFIAVKPDGSVSREDNGGYCKGQAESFREVTIEDKQWAAEEPRTKAESYVFHKDTGVCAKAMVPITGADKKVVDYNRYSTLAEEALCQEPEPARAIRLARKAIAVRDTKTMRSLIRDAESVAKQFKINNAGPYSAAVIPTALKRRCGAGDDSESEPSGNVDCDDFSSQAEATSYLADNPGDSANLDANDDGQACEALP